MTIFPNVYHIDTDVFCGFTRDSREKIPTPPLKEKNKEGNYLITISIFLSQEGCDRSCDRRGAFDGR